MFQERLVHASVWPWYNFAFSPARTAGSLLETLECGENKTGFVTEMIAEMKLLSDCVVNGDCTDEVVRSLGKGTDFLFKSSFIYGFQCKSLVLQELLDRLDVLFALVFEVSSACDRFWHVCTF